MMNIKRFDSCAANKYLVYYRDAEGEECEPVVSTPESIFANMDMADCSGLDIVRIYLLRKGHAPIPVRFCGKWHDDSDRQLMRIVSVTGKTLYDMGWGEEH